MRDLDFDRGELVVREGKGGKDRVTMLPAALRGPLREHLARVKAQHEADVALATLAVSYAIEGSQLYHASWIDTIRDTRFGGLALRYGFLWSDIMCYTVGVVLCVGLEHVAGMRSRSSDVRAV